VCAGPDASLYVLAQILFPDASPLIRCLATYLPDPALRQQLKVLYLLTLSRAASMQWLSTTAKALSAPGMLAVRNEETACLAHLPDGQFLPTCLQARRVVRSICYKLIGKARQQSAPAGAPDGAGADGAGGRRSAGVSAASSDTGERRASDGWNPPPVRQGALPAGGFISHLLSSDNKLLGRRFTDMEVLPQAPWHISECQITCGGNTGSAAMLWVP